jgi:hypothetical protein
MVARTWNASVERIGVGVACKHGKEIVIAALKIWMRMTLIVRLKKVIVIMMAKMKKMKMAITITMNARTHKVSITVKFKRRLTVHSSGSARGIWTLVRIITGNVQESTLGTNLRMIFERVWYAIASTPGSTLSLKL